MRHIRKTLEPAALTAFKAKATDDWTPTYGDLRAAEKQPMRDAACAEQGYICAYCERPITPTDRNYECLVWHESGQRGEPPTGVGLEHIAAQSAAEHLALEWRNLVAVCVGLTEATSDGLPDEVCERERGDTALSVHPVDDPRVGERLEFGSNGHVRGLDEKAHKDVATLGLDHAWYVKRRKAAIIAGENIWRDQPDVNLDELLAPDDDGRLEAYVSAVRQALMRAGALPRVEA